MSAPVDALRLLASLGSQYSGAKFLRDDGVWAPAGAAFPTVVAHLDFLNQAANLPTTTIYNVPANAGGTYVIFAYMEIVQVGAGSTFPGLQIQFTGDASQQSPLIAFTDSSASGNLGFSTAQIGVNQDPGSLSTIQAKGGTAINIATYSYAAGSAPGMQFNIHVKVIYCGP